MTSIYREALGASRFSSADNVAAIGTGIIANIPFTIQNYAFVDPLGRATVTWVRTFHAGESN